MGQPTFSTFLRAFGKHWFTAMSGGASVPLAAFAIYLSKPPLKLLFAVLAVGCLVYSCFRVWHDSVNELMETISGQSAEIERLKHRDYDEEHRRLAERKLGALSELGKDLIWFLLHHDRTESDELRRRCQHEPEFNDAIQRAREQDLVRPTMAPIVGRPGYQHFWEVNPQFLTVLQDLSGRRNVVYFR